MRVLANHGPVVAGTSLSAAVDAIEELEETARLYLLLQAVPTRCRIRNAVLPVVYICTAVREWIASSAASRRKADGTLDLRPMDILSYFDFEPAGQRLEDLETPVPVIDIDVVERNLRRWQERCDAAGFANRPHIKTHKLVPLARAQIDLGAKGITVQKLGEAEVMADAGITDMLLTFNVVGTAQARAPRRARQAHRHQGGGGQ